MTSEQIAEIVETILDRIDEVLYEELAGLEDDDLDLIRQKLSRHHIVYGD